MDGDTASRAAEGVARRSYGKLVASLAVRSRDIAAAEDALSEALLRAIVDWRRHGVPANPEGWLITTARRIDADRWRRAVTAAKGAERWLLQQDERLADGDFEIPDDRGRFHQPYWAARAHLLARKDREAEAAAAYDTAIALTEDAAARRHLLGRRAALTA